jgi:hypothetical protein
VRVRAKSPRKAERAPEPKEFLISNTPMNEQFFVLKATV